MSSLPLRLALVASVCMGLAACATSPADRAGLKGQAAATPQVEPNASAYGLFLAGQAALDRGSSQDAAFYLGKVSELEPETSYLKERAFTAAVVAGDIAAAAAAAPGPEEGSSPSVRLGVLVKAVEALSAGRPAEAEALLSAEPGQGPNGRAIRLLKPWAAAAAGDFETATQPINSGDPLSDLFGAYSQAQLQERAGRPQDAEKTYKLLITGLNPIFVLGYGSFLERQNRDPEAVALYDRLLARTRDPSVSAARARAAGRKSAPPMQSLRAGAAQALIAPAATLIAGRQPELGVAYLRLALRLDPNLDDAWILVGDGMARAGDQEAARAAYRNVRPGSDSYTEALGRLAWSLNSGGDSEGALKLARETAGRSPKSSEALGVYADLLREAGKFPEAAEVMDRMVELNPAGPDSWRLYYLRGVSLERSGRWDAAEVDLKKALQLNPDEPQILNYLGFGWANRGTNLREALTMLQKAAVLQPRSGEIIDSLGWVRFRLGDYRGAVRDLERASSLAPYDPEVNDHLGDAYWRTGRKLEADFQWRRVLTLQADAEVKARVEAKLVSGLPPEVAPPPAADEPPPAPTPPPAPRGRGVTAQAPAAVPS